MKLNVLLKTADYRGDHAADVSIAVDVTDLGMSIATLVSKAAAARGDNEDPPRLKSVEVIEIRVCS